MKNNTNTTPTENKMRIFFPATSDGKIISLPSLAVICDNKTKCYSFRLPTNEELITKDVDSDFNQIIDENGKLILLLTEDEEKKKGFTYLEDDGYFIQPELYILMTKFFNLPFDATVEEVIHYLNTYQILIFQSLSEQNKTAA